MHKVNNNLHIPGTLSNKTHDLIQSETSHPILDYSIFSRVFLIALSIKTCTYVCCPLALDLQKKENKLYDINYTTDHAQAVFLSSPLIYVCLSCILSSDMSEASQQGRQGRRPPPQYFSKHGHISARGPR